MLDTKSRASARWRNLRASGLLAACVLAGTESVVSAQVTAELQDAGHLLRRMTFGPTPQLLVELTLGGEAFTECYIESQLRVVDPLNLPSNPPLEPCSIYHEEPLEFDVLLDDIIGVVPVGATPKWTLGKLKRHQIAHMLYSKWQLREVMTYFWLTHFSTDFSKISKSVGKAEFFLGSDGISKNKAAAGILYQETETFRNNALGHFGDLLQASALGPAMLFYLDNWLNVILNHQEIPANENQGRELLELHTLGLDPVTGLAPYTESDVVKVAVILSGNTVELDLANEAAPWAHVFEEIYHLDATGVILSGVGGFDASAVDDAEQATALLDFLATRDETAKFISRKIFRYLVSDDPMPSALLDDCVTAWQTPCPGHQGLGCIEEVLRVLLKSPEMTDTSQHWSKVRSPLESVISLARGFSALPHESFTCTSVAPIACTDPTTSKSLDRIVEILDGSLGQRLYEFPSPDGFPHESAKFISSSQVLHRTNYNVGIEGSLQGNAGQLSYDVLGFLAGLGFDVSDQDGINAGVALLLFQGSPNFSLAEMQLGEDFIATDAGQAPVDFLDLLNNGEDEAVQALVTQYAAFATSQPLSLQK